MNETVAAGQLRAFIERIERIEADIKDMNADKSDVYKELRGAGFDVKAVRQCVSARKLDSAEREERNAMFDLYWEALTGSSRVRVHEEQNSPETASGRLSVATSSEPHGMEDAGGDSVERHAPFSHSSQVTPSPQAMIAGEEDTPPTSPALIDDDVPAFLRKDRPPVALRPHCLNPEMCAGSGREHCWSCRKAMAASEAA